MLREIIDLRVANALTLGRLDYDYTSDLVVGARSDLLVADDNVATNPINNRPLIDAEYNRGFVYIQYADYLRRNADIGGLKFWLGQVNRFPIRDGNAQHAMVCSFITSAEYQQRFSSIVTHNDNECPQ